MTRGVWGSKVYRIIFFFPQLLALAIVAVIFGRVFGPDKSGMINGLLPELLAAVAVPGRRALGLACILVVLVWQAVGFYVVLFSAGMGSISQEIYEAAALDGATRITLFFRITVPLLWSTIQVAWVYLGIAAFDAFALVNIMTVDRGGPNGATSVLSLMIYRNAFEFSQAGYASALGVVALLPDPDLRRADPAGHPPRRRRSLIRERRGDEQRHQHRRHRVRPGAGPAGAKRAGRKPDTKREVNAFSGIAHIALIVWALATAGPLIWVAAGVVQEQHRDLPGQAVRAAGARSRFETYVDGLERRRTSASTS